MTTNDRWLLPDGIEELLPADARRAERSRRAILDLFASWGYELVMPPLIEYLESLLTGVSAEMDLQTFKLTDQVTGRLMGVRADMTPQAARIDAHFLKRETPVRLCYIGSVLRTRPDEFAGSREPLQIGAELFGYGGEAADAEILHLMIETLQLAGFRDLHVDLGHVGVYRGLAAYAKLSAQQETDLFDALQRKSAGDVRAELAKADANADAKGMIAALLEFAGGAEVMSQARAKLAKAPAAVGQALDQLQAVAERVARGTGGLPLYFDLAELSGYHYYTGVVFSAFMPGHGRAIAKGGRYDGIGRSFGRDRAATGFGADLRELLRFAPAARDTTGGILAPAEDDAALRDEVARLRTGGERVVMALPKDGANGSDLGCDRALVRDGKRWIVKKI